MKILVFDDNELHRKAAHKQLDKEHDLVVVEEYEDVEEKIIVSQANFDIVLTDLLVPAPEKSQGGEGLDYVGQKMPLGVIIAFLAIKNGIKNVGVITDVNHHHHPASEALDALGGYNGNPFCLGDVYILFASRLLLWPVDPNTLVPLTEEEKKLLGYKNYKNYPSVKDWREAVKILTK